MKSNGNVRIVLAGAGHCHAEIIHRSAAFVSRGYDVTVISPDRDHIYSGMAPGLLAGSWNAVDASLPVAELAQKQGVPFIQDRVTGLDPKRKMVLRRNGPPVPYDILSINLGSETVPPNAGASPSWPAKPVRNLVDAAQRIRDCSTRAEHTGNPVTVAVIGGGFGGIELAANAAAFLGDRGTITIYTPRLAPSLAAHPRRYRYLRRALSRRGVVVREGSRVDPAAVSADVVLVATGITPPSVLREFGLPLGQDGGLPVDRFLRVSGEDDVFAVGDCADFLPEPLKRVGVFAVRQQAVLQHNLLARARGAELTPFTATGPYLHGMNLGPGAGLLFRGRWTFSGRTAWHLKALIDRRFVQRYGRRL